MWSHRASDIYQGGENEPLHADGAVPADLKSLDNEFQKNYLPGSNVERTRSCQNAIPPMTVLTELSHLQDFKYHDRHIQLRQFNQGAQNSVGGVLRTFAKTPRPTLE